MRDILTQEEVDALLDACDKGEIGEEPPTSPEFYTPFDFSSRKLIGGVQQTLLERIQDALSKGMASSLGAILQKEITVSATSAYTEPAEAFLSNFKGPSCIALLSADAARDTTYVALSPFLAYALIDLMLGGDGNIKEPEGKEFSTLEVRMVRKIFDGMTSELSKAWSQAFPCRFATTRVETNPKGIPDGGGQDPLYIMNIHIGTETGLSRDFSIAVPFSLVEPHKAAAAPKEADPRAKEFAATIQQRVEAVNVGVSVLLGEAHVPVREILSLKPGDVIATDREVVAPVSVLVEGKPKFWGRAGVSRGRRAVKITAI